MRYDTKIREEELKHRVAAELALGYVSEPW